MGPVSGPASDQQQPVGRAGRYQRSIAGGVGSMIVLVLVVLAFVAFRGTFRDNGGVDVEPVDYLAVVGPAQESGVQVVYPPSLPEGWTATSVDFVPGGRPGFGVGMLTDDDEFVGLRQQDEDLDSMLQMYVDGDALEGDTVTVDGSVAPEWPECRTPAAITPTPPRSARRRCWSTGRHRPRTCSPSCGR